MSQRRTRMHVIAAAAAILLIGLVALSRSTPVCADNSHKDADDHKNPVVENIPKRCSWESRSSGSTPLGMRRSGEIP